MHPSPDAEMLISGDDCKSARQVGKGARFRHKFGDEAAGTSRVILRDIIADVFEIAECFVGQDDLHCVSCVGAIAAYLASSRAAMSSRL